MKLIILVSLLFYSSLAFGQNGPGTLSHDTSCAVLRLLKKGKSFVERKRMDTYSKNGFFLYENYYYKIKCKGYNKYFFSKIVKLYKDSIELTTEFNQNTAKKMNTAFDTLKISYSDLEKIQLELDEIVSLRKGIDVDDYEKKLMTTDKGYESPIKVKLINDPNTFTNCHAFLAGSNIYYLYEKNGTIYRSLFTYYGDGK